MIFFGKIVNGGLQIVNKQKVIRDFMQMEDGLVELSVKYKSQRSIRQNKYLHGVLIPEFRKALNGVGYRVRDDAQCKKIIKAMFLTRHIENEITKEEIPYTLDTSTMSKDEMNILYDDVIQFASEHMNYQILYPNEQSEMEY